ncbi:CHC2 zinc finger domain-containing protein [Candidatus Spongiisocius sp.]|uniref:CHC2 zinc finger domain-containing protein n=1 Tax=Candidatus Spongiisocius sp. TaxID=3101273 RepID=UPI003B58C814
MGSRAASLVREAADIVSLISEVTRSGGDAAMALCRLHGDEGTHSLSISGQKGVYNCFRCGLRGGTLTFVRGGMSRGKFGCLVDCPCGVCLADAGEGRCPGDGRQVSLGAVPFWGRSGDRVFRGEHGTRGSLGGASSVYHF